jgi:esterase/lipase superfamily enzyme
VRRDWVSLHSPAIDAEGGVLAYGHHGRPLLVFPSEQGRASDYESNGMVHVLSPLIEAGRLKVYCVDSFDAASWAAGDRSLEDRARAHERYEDWIVHQVIPFIYTDCRGPQEVAATGCSLGAYPRRQPGPAAGGPGAARGVPLGRL